MNGVRKPSEWRMLVLSGQINYEDAPESIQSMLQLDIYQGAKQIMKANTKKKRNELLNRIPEKVRDRVKNEVERLWKE